MISTEVIATKNNTDPSFQNSNDEMYIQLSQI